MASRINNKVLFVSFITILIVIYYNFFIIRKTKSIIIVSTSDLSGYISSHPATFFDIKGNPLIGGSASLATYIKREKEISQEQNRGFLLVDTGNFFSGQAEGNLLKGESVIEIMNRLGYDAMVIGPRDLAFREENLKNLAKIAKFPFLSANIVEKEIGEPVDYLKPYIIKEYRDIKIGFIGITSPLVFLENIKNLKIMDPISSVQNYISILKEKGVSSIIILSNLGLEEDKRLAREVEDIDIIIGGNDKEGSRHSFLEQHHKTLIHATGGKGGVVVPLSLIFNKENKLIKIKYSDEIIILYISKFKPDAEIQSMVQRYASLIKEKLKEKIGYAQETLRMAKDKETDLGNLIADILREKTKTEICLVGGIEADLKQGEITSGDVYNLLPIIDDLELVWFNLAILEMTGEQIKEMLEIGVSYGLEKGGGVLQVSGLKYIYDLKRKKWDRIIAVEVGGEKLDLGKIYRVAVNGYLAAGLGGYYVVKDVLKRYDTGLMDFDVLVEYINRHSSITAQPLEGRIVRIE